MDSFTIGGTVFPGTNRPSLFGSPWLWAILAIGLAARIYLYLNTAIINPDGVLYIHQARSIYHGLWQDLTTCWNYKHVSIYPILIATSYHFISDWIVSAKMISIIFGTLTIIPIYLLGRRFFPIGAASLVALMYALNPDFVAWSTDALRGPPYWFFLMSACYLFIRGLSVFSEIRQSIYLILASLSFLLAAWGRVEAVVFIGVSFVYLILFHRPFSIKTLLAFSAPLIAAAGTGLIIVGILGNGFDFLTAAIEPFLGAIDRLKDMDQALAQLTKHPPSGLPSEFAASTRSMIWLVALGITVHLYMESLWYPFFGLAVIGLFSLSRRIKADRRILYFVLLIAISLICLYLGLLVTWWPIRRYWALAVLASFILVGFGLDSTLAWARERYDVSVKVIILLTVVFIAVFTVPKNMMPREDDKLVFKQIGRFIAIREDASKPIIVASNGPSAALSWAIFYANLDYPGAPCPRPVERDFKAILGASDAEFSANIKKMDIDYFLWLEKWAKPGRLDYLHGPRPNNLIELGMWNHPDTGRMILLQVVANGS